MDIGPGGGAENRVLRPASMCTQTQMQTQTQTQNKTDGA